MTRLLAIETATEGCSVALLQDGEVSQRFALAPLGHAALIRDMIEQVLADAGQALSAMDAIAFGQGPGSFTGVRIAVSAAQGLALAIDRPLIPVSSLQALAMQSVHDRVLAAFDARKGELYWAAFERNAHGIPVLLGQEQVIAPERILLPREHEWAGMGTGWGACGDSLATQLADRLLLRCPEALPQAADVARLALPRWEAGLYLDVTEALPVYIRPSQAEENRA
ncbi:tRNA (adenosine(37)-N6)-threonylcarbamoyltransferase complex dimerization subunit type 1 TsaB [Thermithiobacillus plumbiphilus]|uniref:tRNA (Adenosine(37)-N6)-threonylcarbamoyltransferase complex dimerization subunit type 1 TsaB n=1 Tax=Thermithiobacillus plumbiphilus TaxID=1729899 RepID=A0ABU9D5I5_9PROT